MGSGAGMGIGAGLASAAGSLLGRGGNSIGRRAKDQDRMNRVMQQSRRRHFNEFDSTQARVADARKAGLHPLAALGIAPSSGGYPSASPGLPGQSDTGSAIETGINTMLNVASADKRDAHSKVMQGMQLKEQQLRNDWLESQIAASKVKTMGGIANINQDAIALKTLVLGPKAPTLFKRADRYPHTDKQHGYRPFGAGTIKQRPGKLTVEGAEDSMGEFGALLYSPFSILQDIGYTLDQMIPNFKESAPTNFGPSP